MSKLNTAPNLTGVDDLYESLVRLHSGLTETESLKTWSRLVLLMANHIGDPEVIREAIAAAAQNTTAPRQ